MREVERKSYSYRLSKAIHELLKKNGEWIGLTQEQREEHRTRRRAMTCGKRGYFEDGTRVSGMAAMTYGPYLTMTEVQKKDFLKDVKQGMAEAYVADLVGVTLGVLERTKKEDLEFRDQVRSAVEYSRAVIDMTVLEVATDRDHPGSVAAALAIRKFWHDVESKRETIRIKRKEVASKAKAINHIVEQVSDKINLRALTNEEFTRYSFLYNKIKNLQTGEVLSSDEALEFSELTRKVSSPLSLNHADNGSVAALMGITKVDQIFEDEDE